MFVQPEVTFRIDLNSLHGDRVVTLKDSRVSHSTFMLDTSVHEGDYVRAVEEEGDTYVGVVEQIAGDRVHLRLLLHTFVPAVTLSFDAIFKDFSQPQWLLEDAALTQTVQSTVDFEPSGDLKIA